MRATLVLVTLVLVTLAGCTRAGFDPSSQQGALDARYERPLDGRTMDGADAALQDSDTAPGEPVAVHFGGSARESLHSLHLGVQGDIYVVGRTAGDFTIGANTSVGLSGSSSGYVARITSAGEIVWSALYQSDDFVDLWGIGSDGSGGVFVTGYYDGTADFGGAVGSHTTDGHQEAFVLFANSQGAATSVQVYGGAANFQLHDLSMGAGEFVVSGFYAASSTATFGAVSLPANGLVDQAFVLRMDTTGVEQAVYRVDSDANADGGGVSIRQGGGLCLAGRFEGSADFDGDGTPDATSKGAGDAFVVAFDPEGGVEWFRTFGSAGDDQVNELVAIGDD
ncbi:MAG: hypothetical protein JRH20_32945, partial [Deltaproteobacteria bacterium]|nr:hypothetical protein [Deltaproteobacteria bacterium]